MRITEGEGQDQIVGHYRYDGEGRMTQARDGKRNEVIHEVQYDGYGNRVHENRQGVLTGYSYDAANRVVSSSAGEQWSYDANGNTVSQRGREGNTTSTEYNAENRATRTVSSADDKTTTSSNEYDAAGNVMRTRVDGDKYGFTEVTQRDVRYLEQQKLITDSWAKGAKRLDGATSFPYDSNGNLVWLDRGRKQGTGENSVAAFEYDLEGHIIARSDKATAFTAADYFAGYVNDPDAAPGYDEYGSAQSQTEQLQWQLFGGGSGATTQLQSYLYANNKPIGEASGEQVMSLKTLRLIGTPVYEGGVVGDTEYPGTLVGHYVTLQGGDIAYRLDGSLDRSETARRLAARVYDGFTALSPEAQAKLVGYVQGQLPAEVSAGAHVGLHGYIQLVDASYANLNQVSDYSYPPDRHRRPARRQRADPRGEGGRHAAGHRGDLLRQPGLLVPDRRGQRAAGQRGAGRGHHAHDPQRGGQQRQHARDLQGLQRGRDHRLDQPRDPHRQEKEEVVPEADHGHHRRDPDHRDDLHRRCGLRRMGRGRRRGRSRGRRRRCGCRDGGGRHHSSGRHGGRGHGWRLALQRQRPVRQRQLRWAAASSPQAPRSVPAWRVLSGWAMRAPLRWPRA